MSMGMGICYMCRGTHRGQKKASDSPGNGVIDICEPASNMGANLVF